MNCKGSGTCWWLKLEDSLEGARFGPLACAVHNSIARYYMHDKQWTKALPARQRGSECYSGWGLGVLAECQEAMHDWAEAEAIYKAIGERYLRYLGGAGTISAAAPAMATWTAARRQFAWGLSLPTEVLASRDAVVYYLLEKDAANDYVFNFDGTTTSSSSGIQITANAQGNLNPGGTFNINLNGAIDQNQDTFTFTLTSAANSQASITTPKEISAYSNNNNNNGNSNNNPTNSNNPNSSNNPNNNGQNGLNPTFTSGQINTVQKTITLTFQVTNTPSQSTTINSMGGTIEITADQYQLGTGSSNGAVTIPQGQTGTITVSGTLTQNGLNYLNAHYSHVSSLDVSVLNGQMTEDGVSNQSTQAQDIGSVSVTW